MKYSLSFLLVVISFLVMSCSNKGDELDGLILDGLWVHDLANNELASDLRVFFDLKSTSGLKEAQIFVAKETPLNEVSLEYLKSLDKTSHTSVALSANLSYDIYLDQSQVDTDGDLLQYDQSYFIYLVAPDVDIINKAENQFLFSDNKVVNGSYTGTWDDTLFGTTSISIIFTNLVNDTYRGPTYISSNFSPAYGGDDDGKTTIVVENNKIVSFRYDQFAPNYKGGCSGTYRGEGTINSEFGINVDFTGNDCDGFHDDAQFTLRRIWKTKQ